MNHQLINVRFRTVNVRYWLPEKGAFRAGRAAGTQWDDANIGSWSGAVAGNGNKASGNYSFVGGGEGNNASGDGAAVVGGGRPVPVFGKSMQRGVLQTLRVGTVLLLPGD